MQHEIMLNNLEFQDLNPRVCGEGRCDPGHCYGPAVRDYHLLHYVLSGKGVLQSPRGEQAVTEGQIFVIRPGESNTYTADTEDPWHYVWVGFTCSAPLDGLLEEDVLTAPECAHIFRSLRDADRISQGREWYVCAKTWELLALLRFARGPLRDGAVQYVRMAQNYIESQYILPIRIEDLARHLNLSRGYFSKIFKAHTGKSPQQYLVDFRLQKAAELLSTRRLSPGETALRVGYTDIYNFSRMFRRRYGVPPSRYDKMATPKGNKTRVCLKTEPPPAGSR